MNTKHIHTLIERYFEGETTISEERWLRENLPNMMGESKEINEALAVMGYAAIPDKDRHKRRIPASLRRIAAAASIALILTAGGIYTHHLNKSQESTFMAYSGGVRIERDEAMQLIAIQMEELSEASQGVRTDVEDDLSDFRNILDL